MVHHPVYTIEGSNHSKRCAQDNKALKIDDEFVKNYYGSEGAKGLTKKFEGVEDKVVVILPNIAALTEEICTCLEKFVEIVTENPVYKEILDEKATLIDYLIDSDEDG